MSTLYLIDDHIMVREAMRALVTAMGHQVVGESAEVTPALADISRMEVDVVLLDLHLGDRSGLEVLSALRQRRADQKVIVLTMSSHSRDVSEALKLGAMGYVVKDAEPEILAKAIEEVSAGRRFVEPSVAATAINALTQAPAANEETLSPRERQVLVMVARGLSSAAIAEELHLSPKTVDSYRSRLMAKLRLGDLPAVVRWALREGLIQLDDE